MRRNPKVSIIIPLYNKEKFISQTLNSILSQTFQDWDCFISDDKSTDNSVEIVKKFIEGDSRFKLLLNEKHLSVASNWNLSKANNESLKTAVSRFTPTEDSWLYKGKSLGRFLG